MMTTTLLRALLKAQGEEKKKKREMNECSEVGGKKRLKSLQMRGRKEMKDLDKSALSSRICAEIKNGALCW